MNLSQHDDPMGGLVVGVIAIRLMETEGLQSTRKSEEEKSGRDEDADIEVGKAAELQGVDSGHGSSVTTLDCSRFGDSFGLQEVRQVAYWTA